MARATNAIVAQNVGKSLDKPKFSTEICGEALQTLMKKSLRDDEAVKRLTGTLISAVASSEQLQSCVPATILAAALRGEGAGLILGIGYHIVPYGTTAVYITSYKGLIQLAIAGGDVKYIDVIAVREGEYIGRNSRTKRPEFDFSIYKDEEEEKQHDVIGYYAYIEKKDGYFRSEYMSLNAILDHADKYSKSFSKSEYLKMVNGQMTPDDAKRLKNKSPYYAEPEIMFGKTVMRKLLNSGYVILAASTKINKVLNMDDTVEAEMDAIASFDVVDVDSNTGEIRFESVQSVPETQETEKASSDTAKTAKSKEKAKSAVDADYTPVAEDTPDDVMNGFFGD